MQIQENPEHTGQPLDSPGAGIKQPADGFQEQQGQELQEGAVAGVFRERLLYTQEGRLASKASAG